MIDLKDKVGARCRSPSPTERPPAGDGHTAARDALVGLGMTVSEAESALREVDDELPVEERVRALALGRAGA